MKSFFTLILVFFLYWAQAASYYFSASSGNDSRSSAQARHASTPWKTLGKLNSFFSSLQPGDSVLLKRGETFFGSITVNKSGKPGLPVVIGTYGTGNKPVITSLVTLGGWISKGNGVWESFNSSLKKTLNTVLINNVPQEMGRYPNSNVANKGYLKLETYNKNSITDNELKASPVWTGAEVVIRKRRWITDRCLITKHSGSTITYKSPSGYRTNNNYGYFIQNDIKTLDKFGEWYYNPSSKKLNVYFGANNPSSYAVQVPAISSLISATNFRYLVFDNLNVRGANDNSFSIREGSDIVVKNCDISFSGRDGVSVYYHHRFTIENCTIANSNVNGINFGYSGDYAVVRNNKITNTSLFAGMGGNGDGKGTGIQNAGDNTVIEFNEIINTGYIGIGFNGNSTIVKNNLVDSFCLTKDDGGGIYTFLGSAAPNKGSKVIGNIILNGIGAPEGGGSAISTQAQGIYMDNNTENVDIRDNTVANCDMGIYLHNAKNITIENNTVYNNDKQFLASQDNNVNLVRNCVLTGNNFFAKTPQQTILTLRSNADDISRFGRFDNNCYNRPLADWSVISTSYTGTAGYVKQSFDLEEWKAKYKKDVTSKKSAKQIAPYKLNNIIGANKFARGNFSSGRKGVVSTACTATLSSAGKLDGTYLELTPYAKHSYVFIDIGRLKANKEYILRYSIRGSVSEGVYIGASLRNRVSPYTVFTPIQNRKVNLSRSDNEIAFLSPADVAGAQIMFTANSKNKYYLDNVELYEADAKITNIDDSVRFVYNPAKVSKTVSLAGNYVDVKNNKFSNSIVLQPFTSAVLIKNGTAAATNTPPEVSITSPSVNAGFKAPAIIEITADASDDGTISKVEFYNGNTLLHTESNKPYTWSWKNVPAGKYTLTAKATDNTGNITTSAGVPISVTAPSSGDNKPPTVRIISPVANQSYNAKAIVNFSLDASDADGKVKKIDIYNGAALIHTELSKPYSWNWRNVPKGKYTITAIATDDKGAKSKSESVTITVVAKKTSNRAADNNDTTTYDVISNDTLKDTKNRYVASLKQQQMKGKTASATGSIKLFPNPAVNKLQISVEGWQIKNNRATLTITNLSGIIVKSISVVLSDKTLEADVSSLTSGMYIVSIISDQPTISKSFIKN